MKLAWVFQADGILGGTPAIGPDGTCYFGSRSGALYAVDARGVQRWRFQTGGPVEAAPCIHPAGPVVFGSYDGRVRALDPEGRLLWERDVGAPVMTTPCVTAAGDLWFGHDAGSLEKLSVEGEPLEQEGVTDVLSSSPIAVGEVVYTADTVLWGSDGTRISFGDEPVVAGAAAGQDGTLYVGGWDGHLYALSPGPTGQVRWRTPIGGQIYGGCSVGPAGQVLVGTRTGRVASVSSDGAIQWTRTLPDGVYGTPAISAGGLCFVGCNAARVYALDLATGSIVAEVLGGRDFRSSVALGDDGRVYASCWDWKLYAIDGGGGGPVESPWPQFHREAARTGRAR